MVAHVVFGKHVCGEWVLVGSRHCPVSCLHRHDGACAESLRDLDIYIGHFWHLDLPIVTVTDLEAVHTIILFWPSIHMIPALVCLLFLVCHPLFIRPASLRCGMFSLLPELVLYIFSVSLVFHNKIKDFSYAI